MKKLYEGEPPQYEDKKRPHQIKIDQINPKKKVWHLR